MASRGDVRQRPPSVEQLDSLRLALDDLAHAVRVLYESEPGHEAELRYYAIGSHLEGARRELEALQIIARTRREEVGHGE